eukprot:6707194-Alexandrium_andersonii.AAC.1
MGHVRCPVFVVARPDHAAEGGYLSPQDRRDLLRQHGSTGPDEGLRIQRPHVMFDIAQLRGAHVGLMHFRDCPR